MAQNNVATAWIWSIWCQFCLKLYFCVQFQYIFFLSYPDVLSYVVSCIKSSLKRDSRNMTIIVMNEMGRPLIVVNVPKCVSNKFKLNSCRIVVHRNKHCYLLYSVSKIESCTRVKWLEMCKLLTAICQCPIKMGIPVASILSQNQQFWEVGWSYICYFSFHDFLMLKIRPMINGRRIVGFCPGESDNQS